MIKFSTILFLFLSLTTLKVSRPGQTHISKEVENTLKASVMKEANWALTQVPVTVTAEFCARSAGGIHDFYSEGDYWWPDTRSIDSPYVQRDGMTNPQNFVAHRMAMIRFSRIVGALASAYLITKDKKYVKHALTHLKAWFIDDSTLMNPNLQFAQAIKGVAQGRGIGIIDTIQLMEVAQGIEVMAASGYITQKEQQAIKNWFRLYTKWLTTHKYGKDEMNAKNNHGTCWVMQTACFAKLTQDKDLLAFCRARFKDVLLPSQMATDGSFPLELKRTKPFGYSIFNLDAMATICQILSKPEDNLWKFKTADGRSVQKGITFLYPYLKDKSKWPYPHDVMHWESWPVAQPALVFGAQAYNNTAWLNSWKTLNHDPKEPEIIRNLPVRHLLIWLN